MQITFADQGNYLVGTLFYMTVDNFISWETKLDLGYRDMGAAYSYGGELEARYFLRPGVALSGNYSLARGYLRRIPTGVDVNGVTQRLDGALTNADREWLNYPMHMWNAGADIVLREHHSVNANASGWHTMKIVEPFNATNPGGYGEPVRRMDLRRELPGPRCDVRLRSPAVGDEPVQQYSAGGNGRQQRRLPSARPERGRPVFQAVLDWKPSHKSLSATG